MKTQLPELPGARIVALMSPDKLFRRWSKRFAGLLDEIDRLFTEVLSGAGAEEVHNLRVALRRARLLAMAGRPALGRERAAAFRHWAFQVMELLGGIRDADVTQEWIGLHAADNPVAAHIKTRRHLLWRKTSPALRRLRSFSLDRLEAGKADGAPARKLHRRFTTTQNGFFLRVAAEKARFHELDADGLHEFRRNIRRWRYLNETVLSRREQKAHKPLRRLIDLQEALGEMQNCEVIQLFLRSLELPASVIRPLERRLDRQHRDWLEKARHRLAAVARFRF